MSSVRRLTRGLVEVALKREHERAVDLPAEARALLRRTNQERQEHGAPESFVLADAVPRVGLRENAGRGLVLQHRQGLARVVAEAEPLSVRLDERADEGAVLIERGAVRATVLCEGNRDVCASLDLGPQLEERAQAESTQGAEEVGRAGRR